MWVLGPTEGTKAWAMPMAPPTATALAAVPTTRPLNHFGHPAHKASQATLRSEAVHLFRIPSSPLFLRTLVGMKLENEGFQLPWRPCNPVEKLF
jgi:hypothetical protein